MIPPADASTKVVLAPLTHSNAADILHTQRPEHLRSLRILTDGNPRGDRADQLICNHAPYDPEAEPRWLEPTAACLNKLRETVPR